VSLQNTHGLAYGASRPTGSEDGRHLQHEHVDFTGTPRNWNCEARSYRRAASISNTMSQHRSSRRTPSPSAPPPRRTTGCHAVRPHGNISRVEDVIGREEAFDTTQSIEAHLPAKTMCLSKREHLQYVDEDPVKWNFPDMKAIMPTYTKRLWTRSRRGH